MEAVGFKTFHEWTSEELASFVQNCGFHVISANLNSGPVPERLDRHQSQVSPRPNARSCSNVARAS